MRHINLVLIPFDSFIKLNLTNSFSFAYLGKFAMTTSDKKLKSNTSLAFILTYSHLLVSGLWPKFRRVAKSVAKFHTREGDMISASTIATQPDNFNFFYNAFSYEIYEYFNTLKRTRCGSSSNGAIDFGMPDFRQLFCFHNAVVHNLASPYGFDVSVAIKVCSSFLKHHAVLKTLASSSLEALPLDTWEE